MLQLLTHSHDLLSPTPMEYKHCVPLYLHVQYIPVPAALQAQSCRNDTNRKTAPPTPSGRGGTERRRATQSNCSSCHAGYCKKTKNKQKTNNSQTQFNGFEVLG